MHKTFQILTIPAILITGLILFIANCTSEPEPALTDFQDFEGHRYAITSELHTWGEAKQLAEDEGGYLVIIQSEAENNFIKTTYREPLNTQADILWIGLSDNAEEGVFKWVDGTTITYMNWAAGEPNNDVGIQNFVHMYEDGTWDDVEDIPCYAIIEFDN